MNKPVVLLLFLLIAVSCRHRQESVQQACLAMTVVEAKGYDVPFDSLTKPLEILAGKPIVIKAGNPGKLQINKNTRQAGVPLSVKAGAPKICIPGQGTFSLPRAVPVSENHVVAGSPEVIIAKEAYSMENNTQIFSSFGKLQGLKTNTIYSIAQDHNGNIWLGTTGGITRYDGYSFAHYTHMQGLRKNNVRSILVDKSNNLWIGMAGGGITRYDGKIFTDISWKDDFPGNTVLSMMEDKKGNIWFGTEGGAVKYDGKIFTQYTEKEGLCNNAIYSILEDAAGNLWFGTGKGVSEFDGHAFSNFTTKEGLCNNVVRSILQDKCGNIWFGTTLGVSKFDGKSFSHYSRKEGFSSSSIFSIYEDRSGNLWFGTWGEGVYKYDGKYISQYTKKEGLINEDICCVFQGFRGILWFGTVAGGLGRYNGNTFDHFVFKDGLKHNRVQSILQDKSGNLWFGTWGGGVYKFDRKSFTRFTEKEGLINNDVRSMIQDKSGNFWFGTWGGVSKFDGKSFTQYTRRNGLVDNVVISILEDASGNIWFGTEGGGVSKFDGKHFVNFGKKEGLSGNIVRSIIQDRSAGIWMATDEGATKFTSSVKTGSWSFTRYAEKEGLPDNNLISVLEDHLGNIWFGSAGNGVTKFDGKSFTAFTEKDGLCNNGVMSLLEDKSGNLWIGTRVGISRMGKEPGMKPDDNGTKSRNRPSVRFTSYTYDDGFFGIGCNSNSICEDDQGSLWIGANDRLTVYNPGAAYPDTIAPAIQLAGIELFNENVSWQDVEKNKDTSILLSNGVIVDNIDFDGLSKWYSIPENLSLASDVNFITFNYIGITTRSTQNVKYVYKLDYLDEHWSTITRQTSAAYGNLSPGRYTFRVKAMNSEGFWSNELTYPFTIRPPWWKTNLAYFLYCMALIAGIILVDRIQTQRVILKERKRTVARELEHARAIQTAYGELHLKNEIVEKQKEELIIQKKCSDELLLNILPSEVAEELKAKGSAYAKLINEVTVLFTDFKDFTRFSEILSPQELVAEIHECFSVFDHIMQKHEVEKIKTIGDSYMAAGGMPVNFPDSVKKTINAGLEMQEFMIRRKQERERQGLPAFEMRLGIHTGPVVAGIVGVKKFQYDIWGDTVNIAARMGDGGEIRKVNISQSTFEFIKDDPGYSFQYRGKIEAKHKGELDMYFVDVAGS